MPTKAKRTTPAALAGWVSLPEAAKLAKVSERHMRLLVETEKVSALKVGRNWLVSRSAAAAFERERAPRK